MILGVYKVSPFQGFWGRGGVGVNPGLTPWAIKSAFADLCKAFSLVSATIIVFVIIVVVSPGFTPLTIKSALTDLCKAFSLVFATIIMFVKIIY